jgi:hypothetical protein
VHALAERGMVSSSGGQELSRLFGGFGLDPPLLQAGYEHRGVERL